MTEFLNKRVVVPVWMLVGIAFLCMIAVFLTRRACLVTAAPPSASKAVAGASDIRAAVAALTDAPTPGTMPSIEDKLGPWPASLAFYEHRPFIANQRHRISVGKTGREAFPVRFDLENDGLTVNRVQLIGVTRSKECEYEAHHLSMVLGDELLGDMNGGRDLRDSIFRAATFGERAASEKYSPWTVSVDNGASGFRIVTIQRDATRN